ncbi:MAG: hypothetical protein K9N51_03990, partial [Candidatus Pacebacteria bacterium]|nr:hypothetical protein [Candidatus Paceibacterota bacterium]
GPGSIEPARHDPCDGVLAVSDRAYRIECPFTPPGYFETRQVCSEDIYLDEGPQSFTLQAGKDGLPEIESLILVPPASSRTDAAS